MSGEICCNVLPSGRVQNRISQSVRVSDYESSRTQDRSRWLLRTIRNAIVEVGTEAHPRLIKVTLTAFPFDRNVEWILNGCRCMLSQFYRKHSLTVLSFCVLLLPVVFYFGESVPSNNDIETWLPRNSQLRTDYDEFCETFGADETILIAFQKPFPESDRLSAAAGRIAGLEGIQTCWTRQRVVEAMLQNGVEEETANQRLINLMATSDESIETLLVTLNEYGTQNRYATVDALRHQLEYCRLDHAILAGSPIVGTHLEVLGSRERALLLFTGTLVICGALLHFHIRCWRTSIALITANILSIETTLTVLWLTGTPMNFILASLPVMVMVFTTAAAIHYIGHFRSLHPDEQASGDSLKYVFRPAFFAAVTTVIGLASLAASDVGPIPDFGYLGAAGTAISFIVGICVTPAILVSMKYTPQKSVASDRWLERLAMRIVNNPIRILVPGTVVTLACAVGAFKLDAQLDPLDFLPSDDPVLRDTLTIQKALTSPTSIEAVIEFGDEGYSFIERLREVQRIEARITETENICHVLSLADFFPKDSEALSFRELAGGADENVAGLVADGCRLWRLSIRLEDDQPAAIAQTMTDLEAACGDASVSFTGLAPLLEEAQGEIFRGFWVSFFSAFGLITVVMMVALKSWKSGFSAMIPNLTPIFLVFGTLGWMGRKIDIGIMMTASIALGLAVDGTFHFLFAYRKKLEQKDCRYRAVRFALLSTGLPIISSAVISGVGLLALSLSPFQPTMRFGVLMFLLLMAALIGDLVLLPAFLALGAKRICTKSRRIQEESETRIAA